MKGFQFCMARRALFRCGMRTPSVGMRNFHRSASMESRKIPTVSLIYKEYGDPNHVLHATQGELPEMGDNDVCVRMLAAPINPADINMIQGVYPVKPHLPAIGGNEGVGEVSVVGPAVTRLKIGDWVVPIESGWGTWRTYAVCPESELVTVANDIPVTAAATMAVNPCTAFRMLNDFAKLEPGDLIIQNGANSGVGQAVIQIAAAMSLTTINIVRDRDEITPLTKHLEALGASHVITDEFIRTPHMKTLMKYLPKAKLALNCVGGKQAAELLRHLEKGGTMVTYGGMSNRPMMVPAGPLIFNDINLKGFWMTAWNKRNYDSEARSKMWNQLAEMVRHGYLKAPTHRLVDMRKYHEAIESSMKPYLNEKQILAVDESLCT